MPSRSFECWQLFVSFQKFLIQYYQHLKAYHPIHLNPSKKKKRDTCFYSNISINCNLSLKSFTIVSAIVGFQCASFRPIVLIFSSYVLVPFNICNVRKYLLFLTPYRNQVCLDHFAYQIVVPPVRATSKVNPSQMGWHLLFQEELQSFTLLNEVFPYLKIIID